MPRRPSLPFSYPDRDELEEELVAIQEWLKSEGLPETEVRLQVERGSWTVHTGDPQYDTSHRGVWGSGEVARGDSRATLRDLADDMIEQAEDQQSYDEMDDEA